MATYPQIDSTMPTMARSRTLVLVLSCLAQWSWAVASPELSYLQCIHERSLKKQKFLVFPINQTDLNQPGPSACAESCVEINETYIYFLVHIPAIGNFTNQLVCGCGNRGALPPIHSPDSLCNLPCPQGMNSSVEFIDVVHLTGGSTETVEPWLPEHSKGPRFLALPGGVPATQNNTSQRRRRPPATHRTCGNGQGLLSVYEFRTSSSANNSQLKSMALLLMLVRYFM